MDRNTYGAMTKEKRIVALRKESVDRNILGEGELAHEAVALRKESVDRNNLCKFLAQFGAESLSARRAWIEITTSITSRSKKPCRSPQGERG